jgi:hypothetical protein
MLDFLARFLVSFWVLLCGIENIAYSDAKIDHEIAMYDSTRAYFSPTLDWMPLASTITDNSTVLQAAIGFV